MCTSTLSYNAFCSLQKQARFFDAYRMYQVIITFNYFIVSILQCLTYKKVNSDPKK